MPTCCAIVLSGPRTGRFCNKNTRGENVRCGTHRNSFMRDPRDIAMREVSEYARIAYRNEMHERREQQNPRQPRPIASRTLEWERARGHELLNMQDNVAVNMHFPYGAAIPDDILAFYNNGIEHVPDFAAPADVPAPPPPPPVQELAAFAADNQNVHTAASVNLTKEVVGRVLRIPVPKDYAWNMRVVSKTAGEIIAHCNLTANEMIEMMNRYIRDDPVYDMGKGIYGRVLDGVWQYIRNSPDKADLCRILKQELKDNIDMCAQGNLTRLCNVLAGYMDGIGPQESQSERLGRELPLLMEIADESDRITKAKHLLKEVALPEAEWAPWLEALA